MNNSNLILALILSIAIMVGWQFFYEKIFPVNETTTKGDLLNIKQTNESQFGIQNSFQANVTLAKEEERVKVLVKNPVLDGSINLKGARFDDIKLANYRQSVSSDENVILLSPGNTNAAYFAEVGWHSTQNNINLPNSSTLWNCSQDFLDQDHPLKLYWTNDENVEFIIKVSLDQNYMFNIEQIVNNKSNKNFILQSYALINKNYIQEETNSILHKGPLGVIGGELKESTYDSLKTDSNKHFVLSSIDWIGITDKYWLTSFVPDKSKNYVANFSYVKHNNADKVQVDILSSDYIVNSMESVKTEHKLFIGAKKVKLLDSYSKEYNIKLFDRAIDFGWLYVLTKPLFYVLNFFYEIVGNFGLSIMIVTVLIKIPMFGLSSKSFRSMKALKDIQPKINRLKELYENDKMKLNQEIMELYKKEKVNPLSGCLPLLIQIPVFFAIYKVLYVTIEMRQAKFFGWVKDLSVSDPTTIFNLFGLLNFTPPSWLHIGVWPILMSITMFLQQQMGTKPADPIQAQMMKFLPLMFLFMFSGFPVGLLIYWTWSNILSILQQWYTNKNILKN